MHECKDTLALEFQKAQAGSSPADAAGFIGVNPLPAGVLWDLCICNIWIKVCFFSMLRKDANPDSSQWLWNLKSGTSYFIFYN